MMMTMMMVRSREYESPKKFKLRLDIEISKTMSRKRLKKSQLRFWKAFEK